MSFQTLRKRYFSDKVGGRDLGVAIGIVQNTMITDGLIIVVIHLGIEEYLVIGEIVTEIINGVVIPGILLTSIIAILIIIGVVVNGVMIMDGDVLAVVGMDVT